MIEKFNEWESEHSEIVRKINEIINKLNEITRRLKID